MKLDRPAILGGRSIFKELVPIVKPPLYRYTKKTFMNKIKKILDSGSVTNAKYVETLEKEVEKYLRVKGTVALSSCTSGLILVLELLGLRDKEIILPSFTFSATALACYWNNCKVVFADCDRETFNISPDDIRKKISKKTAAIIAVHIFGNPCDVNTLQNIAKEYRVKLIFDSAHGLGASVGKIKIGNFGDAEVFSCSPTKTLITTEGGIVTTRNLELARRLKIGRNYGINPDYTSEVPGLSARMTEINALIGLEMSKEIDKIIRNRNRYAQLYQTYLYEIPGVSFQKTTPNSVHTYKDFAVVIDPDKFGIDRDRLLEALQEENIMTRGYFSPPVHHLKAYFKFRSTNLPNTEYLSKNVLCLPIYSYMGKNLIEEISLAIQRIHRFAKEIKTKYRKHN